MAFAREVPIVGITIHSSAYGPKLSLKPKVQFKTLLPRLGDRMPEETGSNVEEDPQKSSVNQQCSMYQRRIHPGKMHPML